MVLFLGDQMSIDVNGFEVSKVFEVIEVLCLLCHCLILSQGTLAQMDWADRTTVQV